MLTCIQFITCAEAVACSIHVAADERRIIGTRLSNVQISVMEGLWSRISVYSGHDFLVISRSHHTLHGL